MPSIFPDEASAGGLVYRDANGFPTNPPNVQNAYSPTQYFQSTCLLTALPSDCTARIEPRQINAIVSELVSFAECLSPSGQWDCASLKNLCAAFSTWMTVYASGVIISDTPPPSPRDNVLWWESDTGNLFISYNDGDSAQWVQISGKPLMDNFSIVVPVSLAARTWLVLSIAGNIEMAFNFPASPIPGQVYVSPDGLATYIFDGVAWMAGSATSTGTTDYVLKTGDTMTGYLTLNADPVNPLHAATKQYTDIKALPPIGADGQALVALTGAPVWGAPIHGGNF